MHIIAHHTLLLNMKAPPLFFCSSFTHICPPAFILPSSFVIILSYYIAIHFLLTFLAFYYSNLFKFSFALHSPLPSSSPLDVHPHGRWPEEPWRPWPPIESVIWLNLGPWRLAGSQTGHCWRLWVTGSPFPEKVQFCACVSLTDFGGLQGYTARHPVLVKPLYGESLNLNDS